MSVRSWQKRVPRIVGALILSVGGPMELSAVEIRGWGATGGSFEIAGLGEGVLKPWMHRIYLPNDS